MPRVKLGQGWASRQLPGEPIYDGRSDVTEIIESMVLGNSGYYRHKIISPKIIGNCTCAI